VVLKFDPESNLHRRISRRIVDKKTVWPVAFTIAILVADIARSISIHGADLISVFFVIIAMAPAIPQFADDFDLDLKGRLHIRRGDIPQAVQPVAEIIGTPQSILPSDIIDAEYREIHNTNNLALLSDSVPKARSAKSVNTDFAQIDPNLALVSIRIEIERRLAKLAQLLDIRYPAPLTQVLRELVNRQAIPDDLFKTLNQFVHLGNAAAHGADVDLEAAEYARQLFPGILSSLNSIVDRADSNRIQ